MTIELNATDPINDDWIKTLYWDVWVTVGQTQVKVETLDDLLIFLDVAGAPEDRKRRELELFMTLPAAIPMPDGLRREVMEYLGQL